VPGRFLRRENRFRAAVSVEGADLVAHVPNSGRLTELLVPGRPVWLALRLRSGQAPRHGEGRRTAGDLLLVEYAGALVSVDARLPGPLCVEALRSGRLAMDGYDHIAAEAPLGASRIDLRLTGPAGVCWVECKSVTLVEGDVARFPDAPTLRGRRHVQELSAAVGAGESAVIVFVVQRPDAAAFAPHHEADPALAAALQEAAARGVAVRAFTCRVTLEAIAIEREIPVHLAAPYPAPPTSE
jgi:sugar fermentation stimulation protein A